MGIYFYSSTGVTECPIAWHSNIKKYIKAQDFGLPKVENSRLDGGVRDGWLWLAL
jgi:hypothetical protein